MFFRFLRLKRIPHKYKTIYAAGMAPTCAGLHDRKAPLYAAQAASSGAMLFRKALSAFYRGAYQRPKRRRPFSSVTRSTSSGDRPRSSAIFPIT